MDTEFPKFTPDGRTICPVCNAEYLPDLQVHPEFRGRFRMWRETGMLIQQAWPDADAIQREQLQTGICSDECWERACVKLDLTEDDR